MQNFIYSLGIRTYFFLLKLIAPFHHKAALFVRGRKAWRKRLQEQVLKHPGSYIWIHAASLGEFEQGRPIIEALRQTYGNDINICLTFYSPSGYEVRKDYPMVDIVMYLPMDTARNAQDFLSTLKPVAGILIKYEFWVNYINTCHQLQIPLLSVSSIFRKEQHFFKQSLLNKSSFTLNALKKIDHFFVQNKDSKHLLEQYDISQVSVAGDTRFDRVVDIAKKASKNDTLEQFAHDSPVIVMGSTWEADLKAMQPFIEAMQSTIKFIVAPHNISAQDIATTLSYFSEYRCVRYSAANQASVNSYNVLILDNMGMLSSAYRYGQFAYIGGAFGKGLHNILEAITWEIPVFYGANDKNTKFDEVTAASAAHIAFAVKDGHALRKKLTNFIDHPKELTALAERSRIFISTYAGATKKTMEYLKHIIPS